MIDFNLPDILTSGWSIANPTLSGVYLSEDEYDMNNPAIQILTENIDSISEFVIGTTYKVTQRVKISCSVKPIYYEPTYLESAKVTFYNTLGEVDRIVASGRVDFGNVVYSLQGWKDTEVPKGMGEQESPLTLGATQVVIMEYYE